MKGLSRVEKGLIEKIQKGWVMKHYNGPWLSRIQIENCTSNSRISEKCFKSLIDNDVIVAIPRSNQPVIYALNNGYKK